MTLQRFDPFRDFWRFEAPAGMRWRNFGPRARVEHGDSWSLPVDVTQDDDTVIVRASLPGFKAEDINVSVDDGVLLISGETEASSEQDSDGYLLRERRSGKFRRALKLPETVDADKAESTYADGVITITLPKTEVRKARRLTVKTD
ncbi:MAG: heat-shock protein Hsp20 [Chloroflexi bacterium]|nr:heat-shock protein Hsp20 [Chloroflexota bacterium]MDP6422044.1 Hsp20/alpha crystallin family protein [SAR202 cluster bacterium]HAL47160.1 Hsp20/alpha crystallin family protein [Dehalococcoidia bacterium]MDP6663333.1 Hsp20/alpha crystallin family protein [SAR202 cluster bacterium]MDP6799345.1 Hsp20/alpha crystallin family protein [SAR202 cluster bacterium]